MEKNGAWAASTICSSSISTEGLLKRGLLLVKIVCRWRGGGVGVESGRHLREHMLGSFHFPLSDND